MQFLIAAFYFFYFAIIAVYIIFMPKVLSMVGFSPSEIGIVFASAPLVRFLVPFAFLRGLRLSRSVFNAALIIMCLSALAFFPFLRDFWGLLAANVGLGIGLSLILPYIEVVALSHIGKERYGKIRLYGSIGFIAVALVLVKFLAAPETAVAYLFGTVALTSLFGYVIARDEHVIAEPPESGGEHFSVASRWPLWTGFFLMQVSFGAFYNFFTIYETDRGVSLDMTIWLWSFGVVIEIFMFYFQGPLMRRSLISLLQLCTFATALRWALVWAFPTNLALLFLSQAVHALSFALFHTAAISHLYALYANKKLSQQFFFGVSYGMGGFVGAVGAGYVYEFWPETLFAVASGVALAAALSLRLEARRESVVDDQ